MSAYGKSFLDEPFLSFINPILIIVLRLCHFAFAMPYEAESITAGASRGTISPAGTLFAKLHWYSSTSGSKDNDPPESPSGPSIHEALVTGPVHV